MSQGVSCHDTQVEIFIGVQAGGGGDGRRAGRQRQSGRDKTQADPRFLCSSIREYATTFARY